MHCVTQNQKLDIFSPIESLFFLTSLQGLIPLSACSALMQPSTWTDAEIIIIQVTAAEKSQID